MEKYQRLSLNEREELSRYLAKNYSYRKIANILGRATSTISREIRRKGFSHSNYRAIPAQEYAQQIAQIPRKHRKLDKDIKLQMFVIKHLKLRWSPEQIAKRLCILYSNDKSMRVSHETIYAYVYVHPRKHLKRQLLVYLRRKHINRRLRDKNRRKSCPIQDFISIEERPLEINNRKIAGHWEGDLIMGTVKSSAIGTLVERSSRMTFLVKLSDRDATSVRQAFTRKFSYLPEQLKQSLTYDQGQEMAEHKLFTKKTKIIVYFAHPHSPWERGTNENTNSLVRDFFPRGTNFINISSSQLKKVQDLLNDRPRKVLNWHTPNEIFNELLH